MDTRTIIDNGLTEADKVKLAAHLGDYVAGQLQARIEQLEAEVARLTAANRRLMAELERAQDGVAEDSDGYFGEEETG